MADFGVSHVFDGGETQLSKSAGTPAFLAPETNSAEFEGKPLDIWAMGVTLYCFLFATLPFHDENLYAIRTKIKEEEPSYTSPFVVYR